MREAYQLPWELMRCSGKRQKMSQGAAKQFGDRFPARQCHARWLQCDTLPTPTHPARKFRFNTASQATALGEPDIPGPASREPKRNKGHGGPSAATPGPSRRRSPGFRKPPPHRAGKKKSNKLATVDGARGIANLGPSTPAPGQPQTKRNKKLTRLNFA